MTIIYVVVGCLIGLLAGVFAPSIPYTYSRYLAIGILAALDSVFGGITATLNGKFDLKVFVSGFFVNTILSMLLTLLGQKLDVDIFLAAVFVFVGRMFNNLTILRRHYLEVFLNRSKQMTLKDKVEKEKKKQQKKK